MLTYEQVAQNIIKEAIKSAVFIDENAKEPYMIEETSESERSINLYNNFKEKGISLSIYKYSDANYNSLKDYLFQNRDIVLLDWKLDGESGEEKSLSILSEIVETQPQIHFCVIYTSENTNVVFNNILSYFSGLTEEQCNDIKFDFAEYEDVIKNVSSNLLELRWYKFIKEKKKEILKRLNENVECNELNKKIKESDIDYLKLGIAFSNDLKSQLMQPSPSDIAVDISTICINNTIISVFNKSNTTADEIFNTFSKQIANYKKGVMHLLGLEMRNIQRKGETFIDSKVLAVTKETLGYHKKQRGDDFSKFIKDVMAEHLKTNISKVDLSIIEAIPEFDYQDSPDKKEEYASMNVFYNSQYVMDKNKFLSFGDVFECNGKYYICITALCDCAHPGSRDNCFYFAEGNKITLDKALAKGESGYISYISPDCCIVWDNKDINGNYSHIVPVNYFVPNNLIKENKIKILRFKNNETEECDFKYLTTIRQNYTQRIANYAFSHPVRVGIDFVKKQ